MTETSPYIYGAMAAVGIAGIGFYLLTREEEEIGLGEGEAEPIFDPETKTYHDIDKDGRRLYRQHGSEHWWVELRKDNAYKRDDGLFSVIRSGIKVTLISGRMTSLPWQALDHRRHDVPPKPLDIPPFEDQFEAMIYIDGRYP